MQCHQPDLRLYSFEDELGFPQTNAIILHANNTSAIWIVSNLVFHEQTKRIDVDCHFSRETFDEKIISLFSCPFQPPGC